MSAPTSSRWWPRACEAYREEMSKTTLIAILASAAALFAAPGSLQAQVGAVMADMMKDTPMYKSYMAVAPGPQDFPKARHIGVEEIGRAHV